MFFALDSSDSDDEVAAPRQPRSAPSMAVVISLDSDDDEGGNETDVQESSDDDRDLPPASQFVTLGAALAATATAPRLRPLPTAEPLKRALLLPATDEADDADLAFRKKVKREGDSLPPSAESAEPVGGCGPQECGEEGEKSVFRETRRGPLVPRNIIFWGAVGGGDGEQGVKKEGAAVKTEGVGTAVLSEGDIAWVLLGHG